MYNEVKSAYHEAWHAVLALYTGCVDVHCVDIYEEKDVLENCPFNGDTSGKVSGIGFHLDVDKYEVGDYSGPSFNTEYEYDPVIVQVLVPSVYDIVKDNDGVFFYESIFCFWYQASISWKDERLFDEVRVLRSLMNCHNFDKCIDIIGIQKIYEHWRSLVNISIEIINNTKFKKVVSTVASYLVDNKEVSGKELCSICSPFFEENGWELIQSGSQVLQHV